MFMKAEQLTQVVYSKEKEIFNNDIDIGIIIFINKL